MDQEEVLTMAKTHEREGEGGERGPRRGESWTKTRPARERGLDHWSKPKKPPAFPLPGSH